MAQLLHQDIADWLKDKNITLSPIQSSDTPTPNPTSLPDNYGVQFPNTDNNQLPSRPPIQPTTPTDSAEIGQQPQNIMDRLNTLLSNPPQLSDYHPSKLRRAGAIVAGGLTGFSGGPKVGSEVAQDILTKPYQESYQDWLTKSQALEKGVGLQATLRKAELTGLGGLAQLQN